MLLVWTVAIISCLQIISPTNAGCSKEELPCDAGNQCVNRKSWCDKKEDCNDGSDEAYCKSANWWSKDPNKCEEKEDTHLLCLDGPCVPIAAKCDGYEDCEDGFDEKYCDNAPSSSTTTTTTMTTTAPTEDLESEYSDESDEESEEASTKTVSNVKISSSSTTTTTHPKEVIAILSTAETNAPSDESSDYWSSSTSYYDQRMKEVDSKTEVKSPPPQPQTSVPTKAPTSSSAPPSTRTYRTNYTSHTTHVISSITPSPTRKHRTHLTSPSLHVPSSNAHSSGRRRPPLFVNAPIRSESYSPRQHGRQHDPYYQHTNRNQFPSYPGTNHQTNRYQPPSYPGTHHQTNRYQSHSYPTTNHQINRYQHRAVNGEPDFGYQTSHFTLYPKEPGVHKPFYFSKNYASLFRRQNRHSISKGESWLLSQRSASSDWGKDTARALVALVLTNNSFLTGDQETDQDRQIMKRRFMVELGADLIRNSSTTLSVNRMALAVNALLAVCENPSDFHGMDLIEILKREVVTSRSYKSPFVYLSLCLSGTSLGSSEIQFLMKQMTPAAPLTERTKDTQIAAIMALSCQIHQSSSVDLRGPIRNGIAQLLQRVGDDGSFGSVYSTALAAQALMSSNDTNNWDAEKTMDFLRREQHEDGSFGDLLSTYFVLPALNGRSLLHLRNIQCEPVEKELSPQEILHFAGPKQYIHYSIYFGYPLVNSYSLYLLLPKGINFLDVMKVAEYQDDNFRFAVGNTGKVYSVSNLANDPEQGLSWYLYTKNEFAHHQHTPNSRERFSGDIRQLFPQPEQHMVFWYHANDLRL